MEDLEEIDFVLEELKKNQSEEAWSFDVCNINLNTSHSFNTKI